MSKFSPGAWEVARVPTANNRLAVKQRGPQGLILVLHTFDGEQAEANCRLMAAAPDMYEALIRAQQFIKNGIEYGYIRMPDADCLDSAHDTPKIIEAALKKLKGGIKMTSIYRKAINELFDEGQEELSSIDRACILGLILGNMTSAERVAVAARIEMLEARLKKGVEVDEKC